MNTKIVIYQMTDLCGEMHDFYPQKGKKGETKLSKTVL